MTAPAQGFPDRLEQLRTEHQLRPLLGPPARRADRWLLHPGSYPLRDVEALLDWAQLLEPGWIVLAQPMPGAGQVRITVTGTLLDEPVDVVGYTRYDVFRDDPADDSCHVDPAELVAVASAEAREWAPVQDTPAPDPDVDELVAAGGPAWTPPVLAIPPERPGGWRRWFAPVTDARAPQPELHGWPTG